MYIDIKVICFVLAIIGSIALVYLVIVLKNLNSLIKQSNDLIINNKQVINDSLVKLPIVISNFNHASENFKEVADVVTDMTADFVVAKDNVKSNFEVASELLSILRNVFGK